TFKQICAEYEIILAFTNVILTGVRNDKQSTFLNKIKLIENIISKDKSLNNITKLYKNIYNIYIYVQTLTSDIQIYSNELLPSTQKDKDNYISGSLSLLSTS